MQLGIEGFLALVSYTQRRSQTPRGQVSDSQRTGIRHPEDRSQTPRGHISDNQRTGLR